MIKQLLTKSVAALLASLIALPLETAPAWAAAAAAAGASSGSSDSSAGEAVTLDGIDVGSDSVRVHLSDSAKYTSFVTATPPRIVIQFENTDYQAGAKLLPGKGKYLKAVRSAQFQNEPQKLSRVVLDLNEMTGFNIAKNGNDVTITVGTAGAEQPSQPAPAAAAPSTASAAPAAPAKVRPAIRPKAAAPKPAAAQASAPTAAAAEAAAQTPDTSPEATVGETGGMTTANSPELAQMADKQDAARPESVAEKAPAPAASQSSTDRQRVSKGDIMSRLPHDTISLDFDNTDVRDVLRLLQAKAKINIIYGPDVTGSVTLHLSDVPFSDAFRTILAMMGLATMQVGDNILRVLTPTALTKTQSAQASFTKVFTLNYAKASDLVPTINSVRTAEGRTGSTMADLKTNSLIVTESVDGMLSTERLVQQLDVRPKQVLIEAKLVEVGLNNSLDYGIQWDYTSVDQGKALGKQGTTWTGTTVAPAPLPPSPFVNTSNLAGNLQNTAALSGSPTQGVGASGRGTGVGLPADKVFGALTLGRITNNFFLNATLTAAAAQGKVKVLSDPKVATLNNQPANINVTTQIPYVTSNVASTGVQTQSVSYVTTGIQLSVTPSINADGRITLIINPNVSQPSAVAATAGTTGAPAIDSRVANTTVLVKDGETVVIGGLISDSVSDQIAKIPLLGDIPILGWLFKKRTKSRTRAELLIFVTPKIMND